MTSSSIIILPKNTPIGPDLLLNEKLGKILEAEFPNWKIVNSQLPPKPLS